MLDKEALAAQAERFEQTPESAPAETPAPEPEVEAAETDSRIPYARFDSVLQERNQYREENESLRQRLEEPVLPDLDLSDDESGLAGRIAALESKEYMTRDDLDRQYAAEALYKESRHAMNTFPDVEEAVLYAASKQEDNYGKTLVDIAKGIHEHRLERYRGLLGETGMQAPPRPGRDHTSPPAEEVKVRSLETARVSALKKLLGQI